MGMIKRLMIEEEGQGMTEYALVLAVIAIGVVGLVSAFKDQISALWTKMTGKITEEITAIQ